MAKRMRRLHAFANPFQGKRYFDSPATKGHVDKEMRDRRRRGWLAKQARKKQQRLRRQRGR